MFDIAPGSSRLEVDAVDHRVRHVSAREVGVASIGLCEDRL